MGVLPIGKLTSRMGQWLIPDYKEGLWQSKGLLLPLTLARVAADHKTVPISGMRNLRPREAVTHLRSHRN